MHLGSTVKNKLNLLLLCATVPFALALGCEYDSIDGIEHLDLGIKQSGLTESTDALGNDVQEEPFEYYPSGRYSVYNSANRYVETYRDRYMDDVQKIFTKRCVACHSCNTGPCQLNLTSYEGLSRGMSKDNPHDVKRTFGSVPRARLSDHYSVEKYRSMGFYPVVEQSVFEEQNKKSIMYLALTHGEDNPPMTKEEIRKLGLHQESEDYQCPVNEKEFKEFTIKFPFGGMPFGCPEIEEEYVETLKTWILEGAAGPSEQTQDDLQTTLITEHTPDPWLDMVSEFEAFLNQDSLEWQAVARYIYEHTYSLDIHFDNHPGEFYRIVRSRTNAPQPIDLIVTEFPTDDPNIGSDRVYYRLEKLDRVIEMKKHSPWRLDEEAVNELVTIFFETPWTLSSLPGYPKNPFDWFHVIPADSRARFIIRYAKEIWHSVARGSICHSRTASFIAADYAWYLTLKPESDPTVIDPTLGMGNYDAFYAYPENTAFTLFTRQFHKDPLRYRKALEKVLRKIRPNGLGIDDIAEDFFFGLRHETSMEFFSSKDSQIPGYPEFKLLLTYADHEKFYYRTVAQYRWWGSSSEKGEAFTKSAYVRTFAENLFASLHPDPAERKELRNFYTSFEGKLFYSLFEDFSKGRSSTVPADWDYEMITRKILERTRGTLTEDIDNLNNWPITDLAKEIAPQITNLDEWEAGIRTLTGKKAPYPQFIPNVVHIRLGNEHLYTLFVERRHKNNKIPGLEATERRPQDDILHAWKGFTGAFPHLFIDLSFEQASDFLTELSHVDSVEDWVAVDDKYGIDRNDQEFWPFSDWLHGWISENVGENAGVLDLRNYDLRDKPF